MNSLSEQSIGRVDVNSLSEQSIGRVDVSCSQSEQWIGLDPSNRIMLHASKFGVTLLL